MDRRIVAFKIAKYLSHIRSFIQLIITFYKMDSELLTVILHGSKEQLQTLTIQKGHKYYKAYTERLTLEKLKIEYEDVKRINTELRRQLLEKRKKIEEMKKGIIQVKEENWSEFLFNPNKLTKWLLYFIISLCLALITMKQQSYCCVYSSFLTVIFLFFIVMTIRNNRPQ